jgi:hypothetical protein
MKGCVFPGTDGFISNEAVSNPYIPYLRGEQEIAEYGMESD